MDYLGRELERQRSALTALLLGGGEGRETEPARDGGRRSPARSETARGRAFGRDGRYAGGEAGGMAGPAEALAAGGKREAPGTEPRAERSDADGRGAETGASAVPPRTARRGASEPPGEGTGAWREMAGPFEGGRLRRAERGAAEPPGSGGGGARTDGDSDGGALPGGGEPLEALRRDGGASGRTRAVLPDRRMVGSGAETPGQEGLPVFRETGRTGGTALWDGEGESLRAEDEARRLSRAVQRDARRYDGGFQIY